MLCAISGESPEEPVASKKSGHVFEKRLIESYIRDNGKDPVSGEELTTDDLVLLTNARSVKPRPPTLTSIPSLLSVFQNEWDALVLETFSLRQQLQQARQELSTSLYENDAAVRVIARLTRERNEARDALARISLSNRAGAEVASDMMQVDGAGLSDNLKAIIDETQARLSKTRKKRPVPAGWATPDDVQSLTLAEPVPVLSGNGRALMLADSREVAWFVGATNYGSCSIPNVQIADAVQDVGSMVTDILVHAIDGVESQVLATNNGEVIIPTAGVNIASHKAATTSLALHPSQRMFASTSADKSFAFYDSQRKVEVVRHITNTPLRCSSFHPDGHIFAAGGKNGNVFVYTTKDVEIAATLEHESGVQSLSFSENGIWLAVANEGSSVVSIWHLGRIERIHSVDFGSPINQIKFDFTGQYLAAVGPNGVVVMHFDKGSKTWSEQLRRAAPAAGIEWGPQGKSLVMLTSDGSIQCAV